MTGPAKGGWPYLPHIAACRGAATGVVLAAWSVLDSPRAAFRRLVYL